MKSPVDSKRGLCDTKSMNIDKQTEKGVSRMKMTITRLTKCSGALGRYDVTLEGQDPVQVDKIEVSFDGGDYISFEDLSVEEPE